MKKTLGLIGILIGLASCQKCKQCTTRQTTYGTGAQPEVSTYTFQHCGTQKQISAITGRTTSQSQVGNISVTVISETTCD